LAAAGEGTETCRVPKALSQSTVRQDVDEVNLTAAQCEVDELGDRLGGCTNCVGNDEDASCE
jgi:hypothetical protein